MINHQSFAVAYNGQPLARTAIPELPFQDFRRYVIDAVAGGQRLAALFGSKDEGGRMKDEKDRKRSGSSFILHPSSLNFFAVLADNTDGWLHIGQTMLDADSYLALTIECPQAHLFEREIAEQFGVRPLGHPWFKPVRFHAPYTGDDAWGREPEKIVVGVTDFYRVEGDAIHEVAVGPVHAGVIEPGHFRFQCHGENVLHLEISLGYQHRGAERTLIGGPDKRSLHTLETVAGDTTIGHATAYCQAVEALAGCQVPLRAQNLRGIALELERLANHTGDLGALAGDVGYLPTASYCGRLRGDFLNLTAALCGNRFGRSMVRPGGVGFNVDAELAKQCLARLETALADVTNAVNLLWNTSSVQARFEGTGTVPKVVAESLGMVGPAARASGVWADVRQDFPAGVFRFAQVPMSTWPTGDVFARAYVRWLEIQRSVEFIREQLAFSTEAPIRVAVGSLKPEHLVVTLVEGWRGEICHVALTDAAGRFARYKIVDPSFHNWTGLAMALRNQQISDFPLCNKSFNLSYCGHDL